MFGLVSDAEVEQKRERPIRAWGSAPENLTLRSTHDVLGTRHLLCISVAGRSWRPYFDAHHRSGNPELAPPKDVLADPTYLDLIGALDEVQRSAARVWEEPQGRFIRDYESSRLHRNAHLAQPSSQLVLCFSVSNGVSPAQRGLAPT